MWRFSRTLITGPKIVFQKTQLLDEKHRKIVLYNLLKFSPLANFPVALKFALIQEKTWSNFIKNLQTHQNLYEFVQLELTQVISSLKLAPICMNFERIYANSGNWVQVWSNSGKSLVRTIWGKFAQIWFSLWKILKLLSNDAKRCFESNSTLLRVFAHFFQMSQNLNIHWKTLVFANFLAENRYFWQTVKKFQGRTFQVDRR